MTVIRILSRAIFVILTLWLAFPGINYIEKDRTVLIYTAKNLMTPLRFPLSRNSNKKIDSPANHLIARVGLTFLKRSSFALFLILLANDVHMNPGPVCANSKYAHIVTDNYSINLTSHITANNTSSSNCATNLKCISLNAQSLKGFVKSPNLATTKTCKLSLFQNFVYSENYDIIAVTETWLNDNIFNSEILNCGYTIYRKDRGSGKRGGGVLLAIKQSLESIRRKDLECDTEMIAIELKPVNSPKLIVSVFYRPPNNNNSFITEFNSFLSKVGNQSKVLLLGDFNFPNIKWLENINSSLTPDEFAFSELLKDYFLSQVNFNATRISNHLKANILDLIITNEPKCVVNIEASSSQLPFPTDHFPVTFSLITRLPRLTKQPRTVYNFKNANFDALKQSLLNSQLEDIITDELTIEECYHQWFCKLNEIVDSCIPKIKINDKNTPPWIDGSVIHLVRKKNETRKKAIKTNSPYYHEKYQVLRRQCKSTIESKYKQYIASLNSSLQENPKRFWSFYKSKKKTESIPSTVKFRDQHHQSPSSQAEAFNQYFHSVFSSDNFSIPTSDYDLPPENSPQDNPNATELNSEISVSEVEILLRNLDPNKACGADAFPTRILKECALVLAPSVCKLFNKSFSSGKLPQQWKEALVIPIHKKGDKDLVNNYRPISLLCIISKVLERCVFNRLMFHLHLFVSDHQHGFLKGRSTVTQMLVFLHKIEEALDSSLQTDIIYLDLSKAFDSVSHPRLLHKLQLAGVSGPIYSWLADYLNNRNQRVLVKSVISNPLPVTSGVPQGSILGPLLFIWYINDLPDLLSRDTLIYLFADDTKLARIINSQSDATQLQGDINKVSSWSLNWKMNFNPDKCESLSITRKKHPIVNDYVIDGNPIVRKDSLKDLGVVTTTTLKWGLHISNVCTKAQQMLGFLHRTSDPGFGIQVKRCLYMSLVRSHLGYASEVWSPLSGKDLRMVEGIQRRATKFILGYTNDNLTYKDRLVTLKLLPISYWHELKDLVFFFKLINGFYDIDISQFVSPKIVVRSTRSSSSLDYIVPKCKTSLFQKSYFVKTVKLWNNLPHTTRTCQSVGAFKSALYNYYNAALDYNFDPDTISTWKSICFKCSNTRNLGSPLFRQCCP